MEERSSVVRGSGQRGDILHRADLIVGQGNADEGGIRPRVCRQRLRGHAAMRVHWDLRNGDPAVSQGTGRAQHGVMLDGAHGGMPATALPCDSRDGQIVGLRAARSKDDFMRLRTEGVRDPSPRAVQLGAGAAPRRMNTRRIAEGSGQDLVHRPPNVRIQRRGGRVVQVDAIAQGVRHQASG